MPQRRWDAQGNLIEENAQTEQPSGAQPRAVRRAWNAQGEEITQAAPRQPGQLDWDENGRVVVPQRPEAPRAPQPRVSTPEDVVRSLGTGLRNAPAYVAGIPRDLSRMFSGFVADNAEEGSDLHDRAVRTRDGAGLPGSAENIARLDEDFGPGWEPQTVPGEVARTAGELAPAALAPGGIGTRLSRVAVPTASTEGGAQLARTFAPELEDEARAFFGIGGSLLNEAGVAANANRALRRNPVNAEAEALEREFGPYTAGERGGNARVRLEEDDIRRGIGSDQGQSILRTFDARRAAQIRNNAMRVVTRGQEPISQNVGEAGVILGDELRTARQQIREAGNAQYQRAFEMAKNEPIAQGMNETPLARVQAAAGEHMFEIPAPAQSALRTLDEQIQAGTATQANVERVRQALNRGLGTAANARDDATEFMYARIIEALDDWQSTTLRNPQARRAMEQARGIFAEGSQLYGQRTRNDLTTGHTGRMDPGGRAIDRTINTDLTGEQIIDGILGTGTRPSQQTLGAVRRIRELGTERIKYTNRDAESGVRVPGRRRVGGQTAGQRRFNADDPSAPGGAELPTNELQALREGLWHRMLRPLDDYLGRVETGGAGEGGMLPAQRLVSQLDNALNKTGREVMAEIYTARELAAMKRLLRFLNRIVPPPGANVSSTSAGVYRMIATAVRGASNIIPGLGPAIMEWFSQAGATNAARRAIRPLPPARAPSARAPSTERPSPIPPAIIGIETLPDDERPRGIGGR